MMRRAEITLQEDGKFSVSLDGVPDGGAIRHLEDAFSVMARHFGYELEFRGIYKDGEKV